MSPLKVCHVTPEFSPIAKVGGLADVSAALPAALSRLGLEVVVFLPYYGRIRNGAMDVSETPLLRGIPLKLGAHVLPFDLHAARPAEDAPPLYLIRCDPLFGGESIYASDGTEPFRAALLSRAAIESCQHLGFRPDVFHAHDWTAAILPLLLRTRYAWDAFFEGTRTLLTIHNIAHQGVFPAGVWSDLGLEESRSQLPKEDVDRGLVNFMKLGILYSDVLTTVSPTYAREIQGDELGMGLQGLLRGRRDRLVGILNGTDAREWSPETDRFIPHRFSAKSLWRKEKNKEALLRAVGLRYEADVPVVGMVSRLSAQKGIDLVQEVLPAFLRNERMRFVVLGSGEPRFEQFFEELQRRHPDSVCFFRGFSEELAHLVEAGSDVFLMPSLFEPCGLNQMYSQAYGTIPVVRRTGGLADSVRPFDPATGEGTGVVFDHYDAAGLAWALGFALSTYRDPDLRRKIRLNGMAEDFSWATRASVYVDLYERLRALSNVPTGRG